MHRDQIEHFIQKNREEFDDAIPSLKVWADIDRRMERQYSRKTNMWYFARAAAAVLLLLACGAVAGHYLSGWNQSQTVKLAEISPELAEVEKYYNEEFNRRYQQLVNYSYDQSVDEELKHLDQVMKELKQELLEVPKGNEEQIINNLINAHRAKVKILERVLESIQPKNQREKSKTADDEISI